jgi:hypothetical protein
MSGNNGVGGIICEQCETAHKVRHLELSHYATMRESSNLGCEFRELRNAIVDHMGLLAAEVSRLCTLIHELRQDQQ